MGSLVSVGGKATCRYFHGLSCVSRIKRYFFVISWALLFEWEEKVYVVISWAFLCEWEEKVFVVICMGSLV